MELKERLKYWHLRCSNCDNKLGKVFKNESIDKIEKCKDCGKEVRVMINLNIPILKNENTKKIDNYIIIKCSFVTISGI